MVVALLLLLLAPACGKEPAQKKSSGAEPMAPGDMNGPGDMAPGDPMGGASADAGPAGMAPEAMGAPPRVTDGPTGIAECDQMLELVCRCKDKDKTYEYACSQMKLDAPGKKAKLPTLDPDQVADEKAACQRALEQVKALKQCE
jgi:hypothetical protein